MFFKAERAKSYRMLDYYSGMFLVLEIFYYTHDILVVHCATDTIDMRRLKHRVLFYGLKLVSDLAVILCSDMKVTRCSIE